MASELSIFKIIGEPKSESLSLYTNAFPEMQSELEKRMFTEVYRIAGLGQSAARSMAPVRHFELLNSIGIKLDTSLQARVLVTETHRSSPTTKDQLFNPQLAEILDDGVQRNSPRPSANFKRTNPRTGRRRRRRTGRPEMFRQLSTPSLDGFPSGKQGEATKNWIKDAQKHLIDRLKQDG